MLYQYPVADMLAGSGRLLMVLAKRSLGSSNFLGIDIRDKVLVVQFLIRHDL